MLGHDPGPPTEAARAIGADVIRLHNAEEAMKNRGAPYEKAKLPFVSYAVVDGNLVTGQNPGSTKETAQKVAELL